MDIIKHGDNYKTVSCPKCNCEFGYTEKDKKYIKTNLGGTMIPQEIRKNAIVNMVVVFCPECDYRVELSRNEKMYE